MNDERLLDQVGSWLKETDAAQPDTERITERAMTQVPQVRQRGRWWPLPFLGGYRESESVPGSGTPMFSALRLIAAGIIVGVFGGFLLAGMLTSQPAERSDPAAVPDAPAPMTTDRLRSIAETIEIEPGVLQVMRDGMRDLASAGSLSVVSGRDGGIWLLSQDGFRRIADDETYEWPSGRAESVSDFAVAPDGTAWTVAVEEDGRSTVRSLGRDGWTTHELTSDFRAVEIAPDGTPWAMWQDPGSETVALGYLAGGDREPVGEWPEGQLHGGDLYLTETDDTWVIGAPEYREGKPKLYRLIDGALQQAYQDIVVATDVGPDGTVWFVSTNELTRLDGSTEEADPETWALHDTMTSEWGDASGWSFLPGDAFRTAPDGSVWFALRADSGPPLSKEHCAGVARFDGTTWLGPFLPSLCVESIDVAMDSSVWLLASDVESGSDLIDLFVVTPEAASAAA